MSSLAREEWPWRFKIREHAERKVWGHRPPDSLLNEWREHVRQTGEPDTFKFHCHSTPPADEVPVIVAFDIDVPESLIPSAGAAPCPICCPHAPKYHRGMIAWWPKEKALRAIGHECGGRLYGGKEFADAKKEAKHFQHAEAAWKYLIDTIPFAKGMSDWLDAVQPIARNLDTAMKRFSNGIGAAAVRHLYRASDGDALWLVVEREEVESRSGYKFYDKVGSIPIFGRQALDRRHSVESLVHRAKNDVADLAAEDDDDILRRLISWGPDGQIAAESAIRRAIPLCREVEIECHAIHAFINPANVDRLCDWASDWRALKPPRIRRERSGRYLLGRREVVWITLSPDLELPLPTLILPD